MAKKKSDLILGSNRNEEDLVDARDEQKAQQDEIRRQLPPIRKFVVRRVNAETGVIESVIVFGHSIDAFGESGVVVIQYKVRTDGVIPTFPHVFGHFEDLQEITTDALEIN